MSLARNYPLLSDVVISFSGDLATLVGLANAVFLHVLDRLIVEEKNAGLENIYRDGKWWGFQTLEAWRYDHFPYLTADTFFGVIKQLRKNGLVLVDGQIDQSLDRMIGLTIDYERLERCIADPSMLIRTDLDLDGDEFQLP